MTAGAMISAAGLGYRWPGQQQLTLSIDHLEIAAGEAVFIKGPSGSGKSTLLSLLAGVHVATHGELSVMGQPLGALSASARDRFRADHIGYIFQMFNLLPYLSVRDNVLLPCRFSRVRRQRALQQSPSLQAEAERLLAQLDLEEGLRSRPVTALSVGQQQRVAAARALMGAPALLIADEPTSALDSDRRESFIRLLFAECRARAATLVFVSHDPQLQGLFERCIDLSAVNRVPTGVL